MKQPKCTPSCVIHFSCSVMPDFEIEAKALANGSQCVCGVDEAGRGPWAGPVVASAVVINPKILPDCLRAQLDDSKKLSTIVREELFLGLVSCARIGVGIAEVYEIDKINILEATMNAMKGAIFNLDQPAPDLALIDGNRVPPLSCEAQAIVRGDSLSLSIAAASIVAKVIRDRRMVELDQLYPGYGWAHNAGYGTAYHRDALSTLGPTPEHRKSFAPIRKILSPIS